MKRWLKLFLIAGLSLLAASSASAQAGFFSGIAWRLTPAGAFPAGGVSVTICTSGATGTPCSPTVSVYASPSLITPVANPLAQCTTLGQLGCIDNLGNFAGYTTNGLYSYSITGAGVSPYGPIPIVANNIIGGVTATNLQGPGGINGTFTGTPTLSGLWTFNGGITSAGPNALSGGGSLAGTYTGTPNMVGVWTFPSGITSLNVAPATPGTGTVGASGTPYSGFFLGTGGTNYSQVTSAASAVRVQQFPDLPGTFAVASQCGTIAANAACSNTSTSFEHCISGIATLGGGTSTITGISPAFTSSSSWYIVTSDVTAITNASKGVPASGTTATFTGTGTDNIQFIACGG